VTSREPVTLKLGGTATRHTDALAAVAKHAPEDTVIVHGGGNEVAAWSRRLGIEPRTHDGLRVTDAETLEVVVAVLAGLVNTRVVAALAAAGRPAVGVTGADDGLLRLQRRDAELGAVGEVVHADASLLTALIARSLVPVVASVGACEGQLLNVNADEAAGAIAATRGGLLVLGTDVAGVLRDGHLLDRLDASVAERMLEDGSAADGMRPKLRAAVRAARAGCEVLIVDGRSASVLERALRGEPAGTIVTAA
jgi:acetylglutamate kinase